MRVRTKPMRCHHSASRGLPRGSLLFGQYGLPEVDESHVRVAPFRSACFLLFFNQGTILQLIKTELQAHRSLYVAFVRRSCPPVFHSTFQGYCSLHSTPCLTTRLSSARTGNDAWASVVNASLWNVTFYRGLSAILFVFLRKPPTHSNPVGFLICVVDRAVEAPP